MSTFRISNWRQFQFLSKQQTYGPTLLPWNNHFHISEACLKPFGEFKDPICASLTRECTGFTTRATATSLTGNYQVGMQLHVVRFNLNFFSDFCQARDLYQINLLGCMVMPNTKQWGALNKATRVFVSHFSSYALNQLRCSFWSRNYKNMK